MAFMLFPPLCLFLHWNFKYNLVIHISFYIHTASWKPFNEKAMLLSFYMILFVTFVCKVKKKKNLCVALPRRTANDKRAKSLEHGSVYSTMKYTQLFMNAIGLISSDIKWASQREEWLFYSLSQLVKDVKLTFTVWAQPLTWCFIALVWQLIHMHPVVCTTIFVCFRGGGWGKI